MVSAARREGKALLASKRPTTESTATAAEQVHASRSTAFIDAMPADDAVALLHRRLHVNQDTIRKLALHTADVPSKVASGRTHSCDACLTANAAKLPHHSKPGYKPSHVGRMVHADIVGPFVATTVGSYKYMLVLVDDHSRFITVYHLAKKSDAPRAVRKYIANLNSLASAGKPAPVRVVGHLHSDNAGEFLSHEFKEFLDSELIDHTTCPPHVHSLNGIAERAIRSVVENMRSNLQASNMPVRFWNYAADHAVDVLNRVHGPPRSSRSAYRLVTGKKPRVLGIWPLGCRAYPVRARHQYKKAFIDPHAWSGMNLGRCPTIPGGYNIWLPNEGKVVTTSDVYFDETLMPWRARGDQRVGVPPPAIAADDGQPPGLPQPHAADCPPAPIPAAETMAAAFTGATRGGAPSAPPASRRVLILFSGPQARPDGLAAFLATFGVESVMMDNHPVDGGGNLKISSTRQSTTPPSTEPRPANSSPSSLRPHAAPSPSAVTSSHEMVAKGLSRCASATTRTASPTSQASAAASLSKPTCSCSERSLSLPLETKWAHNTSSRTPAIEAYSQTATCSSTNSTPLSGCIHPLCRSARPPRAGRSPSPNALSEQNGKSSPRSCTRPGSRHG